MSVGRYAHHFFLTCLVGTMLLLPEASSGFITSPGSETRKSNSHRLAMDSNNNPDDNEDSKSSSDTKENVVIDELSWRVAKARLEEANKKRFLTSKPVKLSYEQSQKWIQRNWAPTSKEEFYDLVANGNLRTPYISKRPEEYYGERGEWISWDHYLLGNCTDSVTNGRQSKWQ